MAQKPSKIETALCIGIIIIGVAFAVYGAFDHFYGITPESQLVMAEGVPHDINETTVQGKYDTKYYLHFTIKDLRTHLLSVGSSSPLKDIITSGKPLVLYVSPKRESIFPSPDMPLYKLAERGNELITYEETVRDKRANSKYYWIGAILFIGLGLFALQFGRMAASMKPDK
jgi:hypothetical protein